MGLSQRGSGDSRCHHGCGCVVHRAQIGDGRCAVWPRCARCAPKVWYCSHRDVTSERRAGCLCPLLVLLPLLSLVLFIILMSFLFLGGFTISCTFFWCETRALQVLMELFEMDMWQVDTFLNGWVDVPWMLPWQVFLEWGYCSCLAFAELLVHHSLVAASVSIWLTGRSKGKVCFLVDTLWFNYIYIYNYCYK